MAKGAAAAGLATRGRFLDAAWGEPAPATPVWLMRQAGRYLSEFRAMRERYGLRQMFRTPELAAEATLQPIRRFALDAAILFSDITAPLPDMGVDVELTPEPVLAEPVCTPAAVARLRVPDAEEIAPFVAAAVRCVRGVCPVPLIGFTGAPLTLATYLVQGRGSADQIGLRGWLAESPALAHELLGKLTEVTARHLRAQIEAGVQAVQVFDSWAGVHDQRTYATFGLPYVRQLLDSVAGLGVPRIYFALGAVHLYPAIATLPAEVVGVDWRWPLDRCRRALPGKVLQGNLDPAVLLCPSKIIVSAARETLRSGQGGPHIFNLGHGVPPQTPPDSVARLVDTVHELRR